MIKWNLLRVYLKCENKNSFFSFISFRYFSILLICLCMALWRLIINSSHHAPSGKLNVAEIFFFSSLFVFVFSLSYYTRKQIEQKRRVVRIIKPHYKETLCCTFKDHTQMLWYMHGLVYPVLVVRVSSICCGICDAFRVEYFEFHDNKSVCLLEIWFCSLLNWKNFQTFANSFPIFGSFFLWDSFYFFPPVRETFHCHTNNCVETHSVGLISPMLNGILVPIWNAYDKQQKQWRQQQGISRKMRGWH